jgi:signal transduction histidine kinase
VKVPGQTPAPGPEDPTAAGKAEGESPIGGSPVAVDRRLLDAVVAVADGLELEPTLRRIVRAACDLTQAPFAAIGVLDDNGLHRSFVHTGLDPAEAQQMGRLPRGMGVLGHVTHVQRAVRVRDLAEHPASVGFPRRHPRMRSFLGVPVGIGDRVVGNLYLAGKQGGFTAEDEDVVVALAAAAAVAVDNAALYEDVRRRERWAAAAKEVATAMLSTAPEDAALELIAELARDVAGAAVGALVLPGWQGQLVLEVASGQGADQLVGMVMPEDGRAVAAVRSGKGLRSSDMSTEPSLLLPQFRDFGPALYAPLVAGSAHLGVLILLRRVGEADFSDKDLSTAGAFASQAALALQLADARRRAEEAELLEDRARIARDLHDLVVQELFAMGMRLSKLRDRLEPAVLADLDASVDSLDRVVRQIRSTIRALRDPEEDEQLDSRLDDEVRRSMSTLGFRAELELDRIGPELDRIRPDLADDVVAVVREGISNAARHAAADHVVVRVQVRENRLRVEVRDDGRGLPAGPHRTSGLDNLAERARRHEGSCTVSSPAEGGTRLLWDVLLPAR